jgi:tyrosyl-tRNA synthetase
MPESDLDRITRDLEAGLLHPGEAKRLLARSITAIYWGEDMAAEAEGAFDRLFRDHEVPADVEVAALPAGDPLHLPSLLRDLGLAASGSDARRLLAQGAVKINGRRIQVEEAARDDLVGAVVQVGKRRFLRLTE